MRRGRCRIRQRRTRRRAVRLSTFSTFACPGGTDTSRYRGSAATPSTGPFLPQNSPHTTRTRVPSSSVDFGNGIRCHVLVARLGHLQRRGKVGPELKAVHAPARIALRHLLMHDAAAGGHPLHVAGAQAAAVAEAVAVFDRTGEDVGDRLDPAMRVPWKALEEILRPLVSEIVEEQKRIELVGIAEAERAASASRRRLPPYLSPAAHA